MKPKYSNSKSIIKRIKKKTEQNPTLTDVLKKKPQPFS